MKHNILLFWGCFLPLIYLIGRLIFDGLSANPIEDITHATGWWALVFLLLTLSVTPIRVLFGKNSVLRYRRTLGLFSFFYASLHFLTWLVLDQFFDWKAMLEDVIERPYITVGFVALVLMSLLAITSIYRLRRYMGNAVWLKLHRLVYLILILVLLHFFWLVKKDVTEPLLFILISGILLGYRVDRWVRTQLTRTQSFSEK